MDQIVSGLPAGAQTGTRHPLDPLSPDELANAVALIRNGIALSDTLRFVSVNLREPDKQALSAPAVAREAEVILLDVGKARTIEARVDLSAGCVADWRVVTEGQPGIVIEEFIQCEQAVKADARWQAALRKRGIADLGLMAPQLYAPIHQHVLSFRLDMDVDGTRNSLFETESVAEPAWATAYDRSERYAAGDYINQNPACDVLPPHPEARGLAGDAGRPCRPQP